jgi:hypothetical protein
VRAGLIFAGSFVLHEIHSFLSNQNKIEIARSRREDETRALHFSATIVPVPCSSRLLPLRPYSVASPTQLARVFAADTARANKMKRANAILAGACRDKLEAIVPTVSAPTSWRG